MNPPALFPDPQARLILVKDGSFDQRRFELVFHIVEGLMTRFDKAGDAARRELDTEQIVEQLAGASMLSFSFACPSPRFAIFD